ncbi:helix-turn-helix domain-containing protein [Fulvivirga sp. 29W222]|uniref:Helix-turn-helix domain-containing protein n=1 Tax=Fulvivirga marina TaxID=2494733 RepID=A0A937KE01_9BACT|nr:AraC family transcriptional regulator [Fulvivirga marina]MBL6449014.1 helix-turn-helix domain-containing protein [Fulvivirga marina]
MKLHIRNMVCPRCIAAVEQFLKKEGIQYTSVMLGEVVTASGISEDRLKFIDSGLKKLGFELITNRQQQNIESIKNIVISKVHHEEAALQQQKLNWSDIIAESLNQDYKGLSRLFSSVEGITIEQYIIKQKIEKVKELLLYDQLTLSEIAWKLGYSSVAHLSGQFQKVTGMSPSAFKKQSQPHRSFIDQV